MLLEIRREMALEADYDMDLFVGHVRAGSSPAQSKVLPESALVLEPKVAYKKVATAPRRTRKVKEG
ncbi:MAG: hypothetical protein IPL32_04980 [Chloracidobacterium sp.]|nr:hypothetical protein [Chloracidobacterium sp.]